MTGIAKALNQQLTEKTIFTRYLQMIGTPEYMSPEQAEMSGLDIERGLGSWHHEIWIADVVEDGAPLKGAKK